MCGGGRPSAPAAPPPAPPPAPPAPVAVLDQRPAEDAQSTTGKLGRMKSRGGLVVDRTSSIPGAGNASTGGLNIPN